MAGFTTHSDSAVSVTPRLPAELQHEVFSLARINTRNVALCAPWHRPLTDDGTRSATDLSTRSRNPLAAFLSLPTELRSQVYQYLLPDRRKVVTPSTDPKEGTQTRDLMVLNRQVCAEISVILYEGYTFAVDVHEGVTEGGIEFLNSGRQRLQYREHFSQVRFKRFESEDDPFGFHRIKRLQINIHHAAPESVQKRKSLRHDPMHTHFMIRALVKLLEHSDGSFGLNYLKVCFVEGAHYRSPTVEVTQHWFHRFTKAPLSTSIHGVSNVEIITRPLMSLRRVQQADFKLHPLLFQDEDLSKFIDRVSTIITSKINAPVVADELDSKIEHARDLLDAWLYRGKLSLHSTSIAGLGASDFMDIDQDSWEDMLRENNQPSSDNFDGVYGSSLLPDEDGYFDLPGCETDLADLKRMNGDATSAEENSPLTYGTDDTYEMRTMSARDGTQEADGENESDTETIDESDTEELCSELPTRTSTQAWKAKILLRRTQSQRRQGRESQVERGCSRLTETFAATLARHKEELKELIMVKDPTKGERRRAARFTGSYALDEDEDVLSQCELD